MRETQHKEEEITLYGAPTCPAMLPVRSLLKRAGAPFHYVDITQDAEGRNRVMQINDGYASVPTLVFGDGSTLTEPGIPELRRKLESLGYEAPQPTLWQSLLANPVFATVGAALLLYGVLEGGATWIGIGAGLLAFALLKDRLF